MGKESASVTCIIPFMEKESASVTCIIPFMEKESACRCQPSLKMDP